MTVMTQKQNASWILGMPNSTMIHSVCNHNQSLAITIDNDLYSFGDTRFSKMIAYGKATLGGSIKWQWIHKNFKP